MTFWKHAPLIALDLEGSGAQDREHEAILEIALVPITSGQPSLTGAWTTLINPGRPITPAPWISPGLTSQALATAPALADITPQLTARLDRKVIVGHNIGVDWRLLHRRCPAIDPLTLIDTLKLARHVRPGTKGNGLATLLERHHLTAAVTALAPGSQPHRALWDAAGAAVLLGALIQALPDASTVTLDALKLIAGSPLGGKHDNPAGTQPQTGQASLPGI